MLKRLIRSFFTSDNFIQIGIGFIGVLVLHNFLVAVISDRALQERNEMLKNQQFILQKIENLGTNVNLIDLGIRGYYMIPQENLKSPLEIARTQHRADIDTLEYFMSTLNYPHVDSIEVVDDWIQGYFDLADQGVVYIQQGQPELTAALYAEDPGYTLWSNYSKVQGSMRDYVNQLEAENERSYSRITAYAFVAQLLLLILGGVILAIVVYRLILQNRIINGHFDRIIESDRTYVFNDGNDHAHLNKRAAIDMMEEHLKTAANFIKQITQGNLDVKWSGLTDDLRKSNKNTLAGELIKMREQMADVKKQEKDRFWLSEGISKFSETIRTHQEDMQKMSDKLISGIVKYLDCNQGGLFFVDSEDGQQLKLSSCYAYDKIRFVEKTVDIENGILGQAYLEGEMIVLKEIPDNYVNITSGLGEALPRHLAVIPLKVNETIEGVMELASFTEFTPIKLELLEKISEIVASAIFSSRNAVEMKRLLQEAKENEEMLRAQEEEMRQNMEEMQAMQENAERSRKE